MKPFWKWFWRAVFAFMVLRWLVLLYVIATEPRTSVLLFLIAFAMGAVWFGGLWWFFGRALPRWRARRALLRDRDAAAPQNGVSGQS